jgi:hypothetical protein
MPSSPREFAVRDRLDRGLLPRVQPRMMWAANGTGRVCDGCGEVITPADFEIEIDIDVDRAYRFHNACLRVWRLFRE